MKKNRQISTTTCLAVRKLVIVLMATTALGCEKNTSSPPVSPPPAEIAVEATLTGSEPNPSFFPENGVIYHVDSWKEDGWGACTANCNNRVCGPDECGGLCGVCESDEFCTTEGQCLFGGITPDTCMAASPCMIDCNFDDNCLTDCNQSVNASSAIPFNSLTECLLEECLYCKFAASPQHCILGCGTSACLDQWELCLSGELSCLEVRSCISGCNATDKVCISSCAFNGTIAAQLKLYELNECWENVCGVNGAKTCKTKSIYEECATPYLACLESVE